MGLEIFGINNPAVGEMFTVMMAKYKDALAAKVDPWALKVAGFNSTSSLRVKYPIDLTALDGFREWVGARDVKDGDIESFFIDSKPFERSVAVPLDVAMQPGEAVGYVNKVPALALAAQMHPNRLVAALLRNGTTIDAWDGTSFFSTSRPVNTRDSTKGTYANRFTAKPWSAANFKFAKTKMRALKAPDGKTSLGMRVTHILAPTDLEESIDEVFKKNIIANAAGTAAETNIYYGGAQPIIAPELDEEPGVWYALSMAVPGVMPFEIQMSNGGQPDIKILGDGTEHATLNNEVLFTGKLFGNAGPAVPHTVMRFEPS